MIKITIKDMIFYIVSYLFGALIASYYLNDNGYEYTTITQIIFIAITFLMAFPIDYLYDKIYRDEQNKLCEQVIKQAEIMKEWSEKPFKKITIYDLLSIYFIIFIMSFSFTIMFIFMLNEIN